MAAIYPGPINLSRKKIEYNWQPWFAWRPVKTINGARVWWKDIYRSRGNTYVDHDNWTWYHYATMFDVLGAE